MILKGRGQGSDGGSNSERSAGVCHGLADTRPVAHPEASVVPALSANVHKEIKHFHSQCFSFKLYE